MPMDSERGKDVFIGGLEFLWFHCDRQGGRDGISQSMIARGKDDPSGNIAL